MPVMQSTFVNVYGACTGQNLEGCKKSVYYEVISIIKKVHICIHIHIPGAVSKKCPRFFSEFVGNSRAQKPNKSQTKHANITGVQYFYAY